MKMEEKGGHSVESITANEGTEMVICKAHCATLPLFSAGVSGNEAESERMEEKSASQSLLLKIFRSKDLSDLEFVCQGHEFSVHKVVVCVQSSVITKCLRDGGFEESRTNVINMDDFLPSTVKQMIQFMYTGDYQLEDKDMDALFGSQSDHIVVKQALRKDVGNREVALVGSHTQMGNVDQEPGSSKSSLEESEEELHPTTVELLQHVYVNSIGHYFDVEALVSSANLKIKTFIQSKNDSERPTSRITVDILIPAINAAVALTGDKKILDIFAEAASATALINPELFKSLNRLDSRSEPSFLVDIVSGCAKMIQDLNIELDKKQLEVIQAALNHQEELAKVRSQIVINKQDIDAFGDGGVVLQAENRKCEVCLKRFNYAIDPRNYKPRCTSCSYQTECVNPRSKYWAAFD